MLLREFLNFIMCICVCVPANAQLGESKTGQEIIFSVEDPSLDTHDIHDDVFYDDDSPNNDEAEMIEFRPKNWKPVLNTYKGCLAEQYMVEGTFIHVNLSNEVVDNLEVANKPEACYELCLHHDPFSMYISLNLGLEGDNDACGCHSENELQLDLLESDDSLCDLNSTLSRIYCGPENVQCYSTGSQLTIPAFQFFIPVTFIAIFISNT